MNGNEKLLLEAISNMLDDKTKLGLSFHKIPERGKGESNEKSHNVQFRWEDIEDTMRLKLNADPKITMYEAISGAFFHTHSYKNIDDPDFVLCFKKQMSGAGNSVPLVEQEIALKHLDSIIREFYDNQAYRADKMEHEEFTNSGEQSVGFNNIKDKREVTQELNK